MKKILLSALLTLLITPSIAFAGVIVSDGNYWGNVSAETAQTGEVIELQIVFKPDGRGCGGSIAADRLDLSITGGAKLSKYTVTPLTKPADGAETTYQATLISSAVGGKMYINALEYCFDGVDYNPASYAREIGYINYNSPVTYSAPTYPIGANPVTPVGSNKTQEKEETKGKPDTPILNKLRIGNSEYTGTQIESNNQFRYSEGVSFSGTTIANGIVHLYFNSDPYEAETTADSDGRWEYTLDRDLGEGEHKLEIAVEDPKTEEISDKSEAYDFVLVAGETTVPDDALIAEVPEDTGYPAYLWYLVGGLVTLIVGGAIAGIIYYRKKHPKQSV